MQRVRTHNEKGHLLLGRRLIYLYLMRVFLCACVRERERERERGGKKDRDMKDIFESFMKCYYSLMGGTI